MLLPGADYDGPFPDGGSNENKGTFVFNSFCCMCMVCCCICIFFFFIPFCFSVFFATKICPIPSTPSQSLSHPVTPNHHSSLRTGVDVVLHDAFQQGYAVVYIGFASMLEAFTGPDAAATVGQLLLDAMRQVRWVGGI